MDEYIVLTIPQWHVLNAAKAWYRARGSFEDAAELKHIEARLFEAIRTLEVAEALERAAKRNGKPVKVRAKKARTTTRPPPPELNVPLVHAPPPPRTPKFHLIRGDKK